MALEGGEGSASRPSRSLLPGKTRYPLYRKLGGPQGRSGQVRKISPPTGVRSPDRPARRVAIRNTLPGRGTYGEKGNVCRVFRGKYEKQHMKLGDNIELDVKEMD